MFTTGNVVAERENIGHYGAARRTLISAAGIVCAASAGYLPLDSIAQDGALLLYAGYAFSGDYANRGQLYPHSSVLVDEDKGAFLDKLLREKLLKRSALAGRVSLQLADAKLDQTSVAFALVQEDVELQHIDGKVWVIVTMQANVLAFNKASSSVVGCYPVRMRFSQARDSEPSAAEIRAMVRSAYTSNTPQENMLDQWLERLEKIRLKAGARKYLRVTEIALSPEATQVVVRSGRTVASVQNQVANFLEVAVAEKAGIAIIPNSLGEAIGGKMAYRFADGAEVQLTLPSADYSLAFTVRGFANKKIEKPEYVQDIFRVQGTVVIRQPDLNKLVIDENVYDTLVVTRPRSANVQISEWNQYYKTLQSLVFGVGAQMVNVDDRWLKDNASRGVEARQGFQNAKQLMKDLM